MGRLTISPNTGYGICIVVPSPTILSDVTSRRGPLFARQDISRSISGIAASCGMATGKTALPTVSSSGPSNVRCQRHAQHPNCARRSRGAVVTAKTFASYGNAIKGQVDTCQPRYTLSTSSGCWPGWVGGSETVAC